MLVSLFLSACSGTDGTDDAAPPSIVWLSPADGATVSAAGVDCSVVIDDFTLEEPSKHNDGAAIGYVRVSVNGTEVLTTGETTFTLTLDAGVNELEAGLFYVDGDAVSATSERLCGEDDDDASCAPVADVISVTAE